MSEFDRRGTIGLCDKCAEPLYASVLEPERLSGFQDCELCGEQSWKDGRYTMKVKYYRPRYVLSVMGEAQFIARANTIAKIKA